MDPMSLYHGRDVSAVELYTTPTALQSRNVRYCGLVFVSTTSRNFVAPIDHRYLIMAAKRDAMRMKANAIVGVRFETNFYVKEGTVDIMMAMYGTAVHCDKGLDESAGFYQGLIDEERVKFIGINRMQVRSSSGSYPVTHDSLRLIEQTKTICEQRIYLDEAKELFSLLSSKWVQAVLEIHDELAAQIQNNTEEVEYIDGVSSLASTDDLSDGVKSRLSLIHEDREGEARAQEDEEVQVDTFRVVGVRRKPGECLGLTVRVERGRPVVARILIDSAIDRQGLVTPGDVILQANGKDVRNPEELQKAIEESGEFLVFKIRPSILDLGDDKDIRTKQRVFVRALFDYRPSEDRLLPCQEIGLEFDHGDIMEILNWSDPSWWQARKVDSRSRAGLIPSQDLEERRQCFVRPDNGPIPTNSTASCCGTLGRREKRRLGYHLRKNVDFDQAELLLYEPVEKMPPFSRKTLALVSPGNSGDKINVIRSLVHSQPDTFGTVVPYTDRPRGEGERDGAEFRFVSRDRMIQGLDNNEFLDIKEMDGFLFGITFESVRNVMAESKLCILDLRPEALKLLHTSTEFLPYVIYLGPEPRSGELKVRHENGANGHTNGIQSYELVFSQSRHVIEESNQIRKEFQKYFDLECPLDTLENTLNNIRSALNKLMAETQWVPRDWVYS